MTRLRHGKAHSKIYGIWNAMRTRCENTKCPAYRNYGGRGITVCSRWLRFDEFYADMGDAPPGMSLERVDNEKGYSPDNCRWAPRKEQANNKRANRLISIHGVTMTMTEWGEKTGVLPSTIWARLSKGWPPEQAVSAPTRVSRKGLPRGTKYRELAFAAEHQIPLNDEDQLS